MEKLTGWLKPGADSRQRQALLSGLVAVAAKGSTLVTSLLSLPLTAQYLGTERFGIWLILSTAMTWVALADLGLSNSLINAIATALAQADRPGAQRSVATACFSLLALGLGLLLLTLGLNPWLPWERLLGDRLSPLVAQEAHRAIAVVLVLFALRIPLSLPRAIYAACQQSHIPQAWAGLTGLISLLLLAVAQGWGGDLPWLLAVFFGATLLGELVLGVVLFTRHHPWLRPRLGQYHLPTLGQLCGLGAQFWIAQVAAICIFQTDLLIVTNLFGVAAVASYGLLLRLFTLIETVSSAFTAPLWPAYSDAAARSDWPWVERTLKRSLMVSLIWSLGNGLALVALTPWILRQWLGPSVSVPPELPWCFLLTYVLLCTGQCIGVLVNGLGRLKVQTWTAPLIALANFGLSVVWGQAIGAAGVTLATALCIFISSFVLVGGDAGRLLRQMRSSLPPLDL